MRKKSKKPRVVIGGDHASTEAKPAVIAHLQSEGYSVTDVGTDNPSSCDYPVFAHRLCEEIREGRAELGILICGTGIGMSIAANKHRGIRAALCCDAFSTEMSRLHNAANVACFGARVLDTETICRLCDLFLSTSPLDEERHIRRRNELDEIENGTFDPDGKNNE